MRLLKSNERSVLWLFEQNYTAASNLKHEAENRGVSGHRLIFAPKQDMPDHLARHRHADLFLDTLPYNAHTTASDALWAGVPVLTYLGSTFPGRVATSLLKAIGLEELITDSLEHYEGLAAKIARDPAYLASLKYRLAMNRDSCPLFDAVRTARNIEAAYGIMWNRYGEAIPQRAKAKPIRIAQNRP
jgi:predicted O-linked N-acetylglucosamine transferase (SPINDLY family)